MANGIRLPSPVVVPMIIPAGRGNRPGPWPAGNYEYVTIHETANAAAGANAAMHGRYLLGAEAAAKPVSWHYTVDDRQIIQHLPDTEHGWHAGDGRDGPGNTKSLGIEVCVNRGGNLCLAYIHAAWLAAQKLLQRDLPLDRLKTHNWWSRKDCPHNLRLDKSGPMGWDWFVDMVWRQMLAQDDTELADLRARLDKIRELVNAQ